MLPPETPVGVYKKEIRNSTKRKLEINHTFIK